MFTSKSIGHKNPIHLITSAFIFVLCGFAKTSLAQDANAYIGEIKIVAENFVPANWMACNGQLLPIRQYTALFSILGVNYGGDGQNTFALPNLGGKFPMGTTPNEVGEVSGSTTVTLTTENMPAHRHSMYVSDAKSNSDNPSNNAIATAQTPDLLPVSKPYSTNLPNATLNINSASPSGQGQPINIIPPYQKVNYIICVSGEFPPRP